MTTPVSNSVVIVGRIVNTGTKQSPRKSISIPADYIEAVSALNCKRVLVEIKPLA